MRALLPCSALVLAFAACASHPLPAGTDRAPPLCLFPQAVWMHASPLEVPGGDFVYGHSGANGEYFPSARGALHSHSDGPDAGLDLVLEMELSRAGYVFWAEVSARDHDVLSTQAEFDVGDFGHVSAGAPVRLVSAYAGELEVEPARFSTEDFKPVALPSTRLRCQDLTLHLRERTEEDDARDLRHHRPHLDGVQEATLKPGAEVELRASPGGPVRGHFVAHPEGHWVRVLGEEGGWSHIVASHWLGIHWLGWVKKDELVPVGAEEPPATAPPGGSPPAPLPTGLRCTGALDLYAEKAGRRHPVGRLEPDTAFQLLGDDGEFAVLDPQGLWLTVAEGVRLEVPLKARACAKVR